MAKRRGGSTNKRARLWRGSERRIGRLVACIALAGAIATACALPMERRFAAEMDSEEAPPALRISEFMSDNRQTLITDSGEAPDWIEIENASGEPVELSRWSLARASNLNDVFRFPEGELAPGEFVVVYANGDRAAGAPFKLPASGGG